jgi:GNAT superfamily N-acetyltransferase
MRPAARVHELAIPESVGAEGWADFAAAITLHFDNEALAYGTDDLRLTPTEALPDFLDPDNQPTRLFVAREDGRIVGLARYETEPGDRPRTAWFQMDVAPEYRHRGIARALSSWLQSVAATDGIRKAIVYAPSRPEKGEQLTPPTGFGSIPAANDEVRLLRAAGYRLEQVVRASRLALPIDSGARLAEATLATGDGYLVHRWIDETPARWRRDVAMLRTRMSTEEPTAGLDEPEDVWTTERADEDDARRAATGRARLVAAVEHVPSGRLAGFTVLSVPPELDRAVAQDDTLVLAEHRGHRLGMLLKLANLDHLTATRPGHPAVVTFNAEENRHMLDVNEAVGFVPLGYEGAWRRDLPY